MNRRRRDGHGNGRCKSLTLFLYMLILLLPFVGAADPVGTIPPPVVPQMNNAPMTVNQGMELNYMPIPEYLVNKSLNVDRNWPPTKCTVAAIPRRKHRRIGEAKNPGPVQKISIWDNLCDNGDEFDFDQSVMAQDEFIAEVAMDLHANTCPVVHEPKLVNIEPNAEPKVVMTEPKMVSLEPKQPQQNVRLDEAENVKPIVIANRKLTNKERKQLRKDEEVRELDYRDNKHDVVDGTA